MLDDIPLGPTGEFPEGKCRPDDEGGLNAVLSHDSRTNKVVIDFRTSVTWLAMNPEEARTFAELLCKHADALDGRNTTVSISTQPTDLSITCPVCRRTSYNPNDIANKYCGACHEYHDVLIQRTMPGPGRE